MFILYKINNTLGNADSSIYKRPTAYQNRVLIERNSFFKPPKDLPRTAAE